MHKGLGWGEAPRISLGDLHGMIECPCCLGNCRDLRARKVSEHVLAEAGTRSAFSFILSARQPVNVPGISFYL